MTSGIRHKSAIIFTFFLCLLALRTYGDENIYLAKPQPRTSYQRTDFRATFNYQALSAAADEIRSANPSERERPLLAEKVGAAVRLNAPLRAECVKVAADNRHRLELRCLANTVLWLGTADDQRLSTALEQYRRVIITRTDYSDHQYYFEPLLLEWLADELTEDERDNARGKYLRYAEQGVTPVRDYNGLSGIKILGLALQNQAAAEWQIYNGAVFGSPDDYNPGAIGNHRQTLSYTALLQPDGPGVEGLGYTDYHGPWLFFALCWRELTGQDFFRLSPLQNWPLHFAYQSGNSFEFLDYETHDIARPWLINGKNFFPIIAGFECGLTPSNPELAGLCRGWIQGHEKQMGGANLPMWILYEALKVEGLAAVDKSTLPLTRVFRSGYVSSRTSWEGSNATVVLVRAPVFSTRYSGARGDINIWHNGAMLIPKHLQTHDYGGGSRANSLLIYRDDSPGIEWGPMGSIDHASFFTSSAMFGVDGPSIAELEDLPARDNLQSVQDSEKELRVVIQGANVFCPTSALVSDPQSFVYPPMVRLVRKQSRVIIWRKKAGVIVVQDKIHLERGERAELRWNMQDRPASIVMDGHYRVLSTSDFTTEHNTAHASICFDILKGGEPRIIGGSTERNADPWGALRRKYIPDSVASLPEDHWQNLICGMWRMQVPSEDAEWVTVIQLMDKDEQPRAVARNAVQVGDEVISLNVEAER